MPTLWKSALCCYFWASSEKNYCHISNQHPQICISAKFCEKIKMSALWKTSFLVIFGLEL